MPDFNPFPKPDPKPKKQRQPLKRTAIIRKTYTLKKSPIKKVSTKQAKNLKKYEEGKREKYETQNPVCSGCGRCDVGISCSHLVGRSHSFELVSEVLNHEPQCFNCADKTETGRFFELRNGLKLLERLWGALGEDGKQRFWYIWNQWPQNQSLWQMSSFYDSEIHN